MKNAGGFITVQYLFSFFLVAGFAMVIISFSATLSMVEIAQYMAFATARNYFASNLDETTQQNTASNKLNSMLSNPLIKPLATGGWFTIAATSTIGSSVDNPNIFQNYAQSTNPERNLFEGAMLSFSSNILAMQIPFFGSTVTSTQNSSTAFQTNVTAFLGREPSIQDCSNFSQQRWQAIKTLNSNYGQLANQTSTKYIAIDDNGC